MHGSQFPLLRGGKKDVSNAKVEPQNCYFGSVTAVKAVLAVQRHLEAFSQVWIYSLS